MTKINEIFLYTDHPSPALSIDGIINGLAKYGIPAEHRGNFVQYLRLSESELLGLGEKIAATKVSDISSPLDELTDPDYLDIDYELKRLKGEEPIQKVRSGSEAPIIYDGNWLQRILHKVMAEKLSDEFRSDFVHSIFTGRLFGTFGTKRYHARVVLMGNPSLISTSGLVEAPARPREYYLLKAGFLKSGRDLSELDEIYEERFVEYDDPNTTEILLSYTLQTVFYELTGEAFCEHPCCCLYNSHWQEEVLDVQLEGKLCERHRKILAVFQ